MVDLVLDAKSYFADPFASWQRGSNENLNGLLPRYPPKRGNLGAITERSCNASKIDSTTDRESG